VINVTPRPLYSEEWPFGAHWIGGWVGLKAGLDVEAKRKIYGLCGNRTSVYLQLEEDIFGIEY
jgi:hypothetical protein